MKKDFNQEYGGVNCYWGLKPHKEVVEIEELMRRGAKVLDLGSGEGRDLLFLAKKGFNVTAMDISARGIERTKKLAEEKGVKIKTVIGDIKQFEFREKYDLIISMAFLHFLKLIEIKKIISKMKEMTNVGGYNVITAFTEDNPFKKFPHLFAKDELKKFYSDWDILKYKEFITLPETHGDGLPHRHGKVVLISRKPHVK